MAYSKGQLEALWGSVNPGTGDPHLMGAIGLAESGGNPDAENSCCVGLWQVNVLVHPYTRAQMKNPVANARAAGSIYRSQGITAWESYTNGAYKQFLGGGTNLTGVSLPGGSQGGGIMQNASLGLPGEELFTNPGSTPFFGPAFEGLKGLTKLVELLTSREGWIRIGKVLLGAFLLLTGVLGMANINAGEQVVSGGKKAAGAAATVAAVVPK